MDATTLLIAATQGGLAEFVTEIIKEIPWLKGKLKPEMVRLLSLVIAIVLVVTYSYAENMGLFETGTFGAVVVTSMRVIYHQGKKSRVTTSEPKS